jgi:hypothetical protein
VQTCVVIMAREAVLHYVRNAYYAHSSMADIFRTGGAINLALF